MEENEIISYHQQLMDEAYEFWEKHPNELSYKQFLKQLEKELGIIYKQAVITGNLNYQVENGGFEQWKYNDYHVTLDDLINFFKSFTFDKTISNIIFILENVKETIEWYEDGYKLIENIDSNYFDVFSNALEVEECKSFENHTKQYYKFNKRLMEILNEYFEKEINKIEAEETGDCYFNYFS